MPASRRAGELECRNAVGLQRRTTEGASSVALRPRPRIPSRVSDVLVQRRDRWHINRNTIVCVKWADARRPSARPLMFMLMLVLVLVLP